MYRVVSFQVFLWFFGRDCSCSSISAILSSSLSGCNSQYQFPHHCNHSDIQLENTFNAANFGQIRNQFKSGELFSRLFRFSPLNIFVSCIKCKKSILDRKDLLPFYRSHTSSMSGSCDRRPPDFSGNCGIVCRSLYSVCHPCAFDLLCKET